MHKPLPGINSWQLAVEKQQLVVFSWQTAKNKIQRLLQTANCKLQALFLFVTLCFATHHALASHAMASDLTYKCLGGNKYEVTLSFYRDCAGIPAPNNPVIDVTSASCGQHLTVTLSPIAGTGKDVTPACPTTVTTCHGGTAIGVQQWVYTGIITLPMQCTDWTFSYSLCCRNAAITTISNPGTSTIYLFAMLNNIAAPCHNSPVFSSKPVPFCCVGQPYCFSQGATDESGDSLAYDLITPLQTASTTVNYLSPYTASQPLSSSPPVSFDSTNGEICMTPQLIQVTVMAVLVKDYVNGVLVGTVERDMQIIVMNCSSTLPWLTGINGTNNFNMTVCAGAPFCFKIFSNEADTGLTLTVTWNGGIPGATFDTAGTPHPTSTFCWDPADSLISDNPYCFTATVTNNACPFYQSQVFTYCITVGGLTVNLGPDQAISCADEATIYATTQSAYRVNYLWSNGDTTNYITTGVGTYWCTVNNGFCTASDTVVITSPFAPVAAFTRTSPSCLNDTVDFTDHSTSGGGSIITNWTWNFGDGSATSTTQNPTHVFPGTGTYIIQLLVMNNFGCVDSITDTLAIFPPPTAAFTYIDSCPGQSVSFTDQSTGGATAWNWNFGDGQTSTSQNPTHTYISPGSYNVILIASNNNGCPDTVSKTITVNPALIANFTTSPVCIGNSTTFSSTSSGTIISWSWNFGNGDSSSLQNPTITYDSAGTYHATVIVTSASGCIDSITKPVIVHPLPVAHATPGVTSCSGSNDTLIASGGVTYQWLPGGASNDTLIINPAGSATYTVIVTDANGCTASDTVGVTVTPLPMANAGANQTICSGDSVTLTATGGGGYLWNTGSIDSTIVVNPTSTTTYTVTVTNASGCSSTATVTVNVNPLPVATAIAAQNICVGANATLVASGGGTYSWSNGGITNSISVSPVSTTNYVVTVTNGTGCTVTDTATVIVHPLPAANAGPDQTICNGLTATLTGSGGTSYQWNPGGSINQTINVNPATTTTYYLTVTDGFGCVAGDSVIVNVNPSPVVMLNPVLICSGDSPTLDAGNPGCTYIWAPDGETTESISVSTAGNYGVTVTNSFGCSDSAQTVVIAGGTITINPVVASICGGQSTTIDAGNPGYNFNWSTGQTTETITVSTGGSYSVTITDPAGCSATFVNTVTENPLPTVNFISASTCFGSSTPFTDQSTISPGNLTSWNWNFGDGQTSVQQNPAHTYANEGAYTVTLQVTSNNGCSQSASKSVAINPLPLAGFGVNTVCYGDASLFTNMSVVSSGGIVSWGWAFGDGQTSNAQNPQHIYATSGNYNATLIVTTNNGCVDTISDPVTVNSLPAPAFTAPPVCNGTQTIFNNTSTINNGTIASYLWNFGDGSTSSSLQPSHQYSSSGNYTVSLTATSAQGCPQTVQNTANVLANPNASFLSQNVCQGGTMSFIDNSTVQGGSVASWSWNFSDETSSNIPSPTHLYTSSGTYDVQLIVTSNSGCVDTVTNAVTIYPLPSANFSFDNECLNNQNSFTDLSSIVSGNIVSYLWTFGDGTTSSSANPQHLYNTVNNYNVALTVTSDQGCVDTVSQKVSIFPMPTVAFSGANVCLADTTQFSNLTTIPDNGGAFTSSWNFGDAGTSFIEAPAHIYTSGGSYNVTLTVTTTKGCADSLTRQVEVYLPPQPAFVDSSNCFGTSSYFNDKSICSSGSIVDWGWDFGDSSWATGSSVTHTYSAPGEYNVTLAVITNFGCKNAANKPLSIHALPSPAISAPNACQGSPVSFINNNDTIGAPVSNSLWNFGDGATSDSSNSSHIYNAPGAYNVMLQTTSIFGCVANAGTSITIYPQANPLFTAPDECLGATITFTNNTTINSGNVQQYNWNFGDGFGTSTLPNPQYKYPLEGTFPVLLVAVSDQGCTDSITQPVTIYPLPVVSLSGETTGCSPVDANFTNSSTINSGSIVGWLWDFGDGDVSTAQDPSHIYTTPGYYTITLTVSSNEGCVASAASTEYMVVLPSAKADFTMNPTTVEALDPLVYFTNLSSNYDTYNWNFGDGSTSTVFSPSHQYANAGDYTIVLIVNNSYNCPDTAFRRIAIEPVSTLFAPNAFTPNGDGVNDNWMPVYTDMTDIRVWIFNRWGEMLTSWDGLSGYWDGTYKGKPAQEDVYVYQIQGTGEDGKIYNWTGDITLVR